MTQSRPQILGAVARLQEVRSERVLEVMGRMLDARLLEYLPIQLLEVRGRILRQSVTRPEEVFRVAVFDLQQQLTQFRRDDVVDCVVGLLPRCLDTNLALRVYQFILVQHNRIYDGESGFELQAHTRFDPDTILRRHLYVVHGLHDLRQHLWPDDIVRVTDRRAEVIESVSALGIRGVPSVD